MGDCNRGFSLEPPSTTFVSGTHICADRLQNNQHFLPFTRFEAFLRSDHDFPSLSRRRAVDHPSPASTFCMTINELDRSMGSKPHGEKRWHERGL